MKKYGDSITRLLDDLSSRYMRAFNVIARRIEVAVFAGRATREPQPLPWEPIPGHRCPFCHGHGHDDGGPGSWSCFECDRTGRLPYDWRTKYHLDRIPPGSVDPTREWVVLTQEQIRDKAWREVVDYYALRARQYRGIMGWESPEVDFDAPRLPTGEYLDRPTDPKHPRFQKEE